MQLCTKSGRAKKTEAVCLSQSDSSAHLSNSIAWSRPCTNGPSVYGSTRLPPCCMAVIGRAMHVLEEGRAMHVLEEGEWHVAA